MNHSLQEKGFKVVYLEETYAFVVRLWDRPVGDNHYSTTIAEIDIELKDGGPHLLTLEELEKLRQIIDRLIGAWHTRND